MPSYDERTPSGWPLPFKSNTLEVDVERLRNTLLAIDDALRLIKQNFSLLLDEKFYGLEEKQFILDTRMDIIAGQATEDTEILDARVDANSEIHPNLGHNIRFIHSKLLELKAELEQKEQDLKAYIDNADSEIYDCVDEAKAEQAIKNTELKAYSDELADMKPVKE